MRNDIGTIASLCAIIAVLAGGLRWVYGAIARLERAVKTVESRSKELKPNGGASLADNVAAIRKTVDQHSATLAKQDDALREQGAAITQLALHLASTPPTTPPT
jgi:hypothetical protein